MQVKKLNVLSFSVSGVEGIDSIQVIAEEMDRGCGRLTVVCCAESWTAKWLNMGCSLPDFISGVSNDYIIGCFAPSLGCYTDADNGVNLRFVKAEIIKRRRDRLIDSNKARAMWTEAGDAENVKENCCGYLPGDELPWLFGSEPWHAQWPQVENPEYKYLEKILDAMREGFRQLVEESKPVASSVGA